MSKKKEFTLTSIMIILLLNIFVINSTLTLQTCQGTLEQVSINDYTYSTYLGGSSTQSSDENVEDVIRDVTTDSQDNIIVTGHTLSPNFPVQNAFQENYAGGGNDVHGVGGDAFISKFDKEGELLWSTYLGGSGIDGGVLVEMIDSDIVVIGMTKSSDFPTTENAYQINYSENYDLFITRFSTNGSLLYSSYFGSTGSDSALGLELDSLGNLLIVGATNSADFPVTTDADQGIIAGQRDGFLLHLTGNCTNILYSTYLGGSQNDSINDVSLDLSGNILVTGYTTSSDFPVTSDAFQVTPCSSECEGFIAKYSPTGQMTYATYFGGTQTDFSSSIATDSNGNIIVAGRTMSPDFPTANTWKPNYTSTMFNGFITKFTDDGQNILFSGNLGGPGWDILNNVDVDSDDNIIISGYADLFSDGFPLRMAFQEEIQGRCDIVIMKFSRTGSILFGTYYGGNELDNPCKQHFNGESLYIVGFTQSNDFLVTSDAFQDSMIGNYDGFLIRFDIQDYIRAQQEAGAQLTFEPYILLFLGLVSIGGVGLIIYKVLKKTT